MTYDHPVDRDRMSGLGAAPIAETSESPGRTGVTASGCAVTIP